jgi:predicted nucleic-acid-binding Zn-ribbon protein
MSIICTKCKSKNVHIKSEPIEETDTTIDNMVGIKAVPAIYKMTTWVCEDCGYEVTG